MGVENGLAVLIAILAIAAVGSLVIAVRAVAPFRQPSGVPSVDYSDMRAIIRSFRSRVFLSLAVFVVSLVALIFLAYAVPQILAVPGVVAPGVALSAALLTFRALPVSGFAPRQLMSAPLEPRAPWSFAPIRSLAAVSMMCAAVIALTIGLGVASESHGWGFAGLSTPPAVMVSLVVGTLLLVLCSAAAALRHLAASRAGATSELMAADFAIRALMSRLVVAVVASTFAFYLAVVAGQTGGWLAMWARVSTGDGRPDALAALLAPILEPVGLLSAAASIVFTITSIMLIVSLTRSRSVRAVESPVGA